MANKFEDAETKANKYSLFCTTSDDTPGVSSMKRWLACRQSRSYKHLFLGNISDSPTEEHPICLRFQQCKFKRATKVDALRILLLASASPDGTVSKRNGGDQSTTDRNIHIKSLVGEICG
jgi:hypothetical protein